MIKYTENHGLFLSVVHTAEILANMLGETNYQLALEVIKNRYYDYLRTTDQELFDEVNDYLKRHSVECKMVDKAIDNIAYTPYGDIPFNIVEL